MSENIKSLYLSRRKNKLFPKLNYKQAERNINYTYIDTISFNLMDNMTKFKNSEINKKELNLRLITNLSLIISKGNIDQKKLKKKKDKNDVDSKKCSIQNYGIYFPTNRITCLEENKDNNYGTDNANKKYVRNNNLKIPFSYESINAFLPIGKNLFKKKDNKLSLKSDGRICNNTSYEKGKSSKNSSYYYESNENDNSFSLISEESLSNKEVTYVNNKAISDGINKSIFKNLKSFRKYRDLVDYIECPLIKNYSKKEKYNNFIKLLNNIDEIIEYNDNNMNLKGNFQLNDLIDIDDYNFKRIYIDNFDINYLNNEQYKNNLSPIRNDNKKNKSINLSKINHSSEFLVLNSSIKNDLSETLDKTSSSMNQKINNNFINLNDKSHEISSSLRKKYLKKMNENYINLIHIIYMNFISKCSSANLLFIDENMIKKLFLQFFKKFLLAIGINNKKIYEKILKNQIFNKKILSFDQFIQCFDIILYDNDNENILSKFLFLINIINQQNNNNILEYKQIELYFDLLGCQATYIPEFCENLGDRLIIRYNSIYRTTEVDNIIAGKYNFIKMLTVLESFFDDLQIET